MKKLIFALITIFMTQILSAQTDNYKIAFENFQKKYNSGKFEQIFNDFSPEMQQTLPLEKTKQFFGGLKNDAGKIESKEFIKYQHGTFATYKTKFENGIFEVNISLDELNKINGLSIKPYLERKSVNNLNNYPKEISEIIYSKSKDLPNNAQVSIAVIENGKTNYYGIIKENDSIKPTQNQNKIFEIGSLTKVFTSTVLANLVEEKKIRLSDLINPFYPFKFKNNIKITFESLANHTSGLPRLPQNFDLSNTTNPYINYKKKNLDDYLENLLTLENAPSTKYSYSNLGAGILGYTLGLSQNMSFKTLLQKKVFDKYKMTNSYTSSQDLGGKLIKGLNENGEIVTNWDFDVLFGGGGILSSAEDLQKFAFAQFNPINRELALTRQTTFVINNTMKIGLGWHILKRENEQELIWHNGGTGGYSSSMALNIRNKKAVIILANVSGINENIDNLCFQLMKKINDK
jgi:CubicO group peptidase (beta-lactamase class C family)